MQGRVRLRIAGLFAVMLIGLGIAALAVPHLLDAGSLRNRITGQLARWSGGEVAIAGSTRLVYFPFVVLELDDVHFAAPRRLPTVAGLQVKTMRIEFAPWSIVSGDAVVTRVTLVEPKVRLDRPAGASPAQSGPVAIVEALRSAPMARLSLVDGGIDIAGTGTAQLASAVNAELAISEAGALAGSGHFAWRGQTLAFSLDSTAPVVQGDSAHAPLRLTLSSPLIDATVSGEASLAESLQLHGSLEVRIDRLRAFAAWLGLPAPDGRGLGPFTASGRFNWRDRRIAVEEGAFTVDGNAAQGALVIDYAGARPAIAGTLALQQLGLSQYYAASEAAGSKAPAELDWALLNVIDLDLRLSTSRVDAKPFSLGQSAFSVRLKDGSLAADFSVMSLCNGQADGRLELVALEEAARLHLMANLSAVAVKPCLELFTPVSPLEGTASLNVDLRARGATLPDLAGDLDGGAKLAVTGGQTSADIANLLVRARRGALRGWGATAGSPTRFEKLTGSCRFEHGIARCRGVKAATGASEIVGGGSVDFRSGEIDWRLRLTSKTDGRLTKVEQLVAGLLEGIAVEGSWAEPRFRLVHPGASGDGLAPGARGWADLGRAAARF